jgi:hypothetical protein
VTEDDLSDAFNRFLRYSQGAKRYGSNVPGPLEAQKRLAKRRMMALAGVGATPTVDPAVLFGRGGPKMGKTKWLPPKRKVKEDKIGKSRRCVVAYGVLMAIGFSDTSWLEQLGLIPTPTALPEELFDPRTSENIIPIRHMRNKPSKLTTWLDLRERLRDANITQMENLALSAEKSGLDRVEFSQRAFRSILWDRELNWEQVTGFLMNTSLNIPEARLLTYLVSQFSACKLTIAEFDAGKRLVEGCLKLGLVSEEEIPELIETAFQAVNAISVSIAADSEVKLHDLPEFLIDAIWRGLKACRIKSIPLGTSQRILERLPRARSLVAFRLELYRYSYPIHVDDGGTREIERCLAWWAIQAFDLRSSATMNHSVLTDIIEDLYPALISEGTIVKATSFLLERLMSDDAGVMEHWDTILNGWLICLQKAFAYRVWSPAIEVIAAKDISPLDLLDFFSRLTPRHLMGEALLRYWFPRLPIPPTFGALKQNSLGYNDTENAISLASHTRDWNGVLQDFRFLHQERHRNSPHSYDTFTYLLITLHRRHRITMANQQMIMSLCEQMYGPQALSQMCEHARASGVYFYPPLAEETIARLGTQEPQVALSLYKSRSIQVSRVPELLPTLIEDGVHSLDIFKLLHQDDPHHYLPLEKRTTHTNSMTQERLHLIHECANAFSKQTKYSFRTVYRNVYLCYRFCSSRGAPIHGMMSRALVRAGITNYLAAGLNVSQTQVKWVLDVVDKVEGREVAQELDELVSSWMKKVYDQWNKHNKGLKRTRNPLPDVKFRRGKDGLLKGVPPYMHEMDYANIPRKIRQYLGTGEWNYSNIDAVFQKKLQTTFRKTLSPPKWKESVEYMATDANWEPINAAEVEFAHAIAQDDALEFDNDQLQDLRESSFGFQPVKCELEHELHDN